jgi:hypothetical protein
VEGLSRKKLSTMSRKKINVLMLNNNYNFNVRDGYGVKWIESGITMPRDKAYLFGLRLATKALFDIISKDNSLTEISYPLLTLVNYTHCVIHGIIGITKADSANVWNSLFDKGNYKFNGSNEYMLLIKATKARILAIDKYNTISNPRRVLAVRALNFINSIINDEMDTESKENNKLYEVCTDILVPQQRY